MVGSMVKRALNAAVLLLALAAFFFLPLGAKTPYEHLRAILATEPAQEASRALVDTSRRLLGRVAEEVERMRREAPRDAPSAPPPSGSASTDPAGPGTSRSSPAEETGDVPVVRLPNPR